MKASYRLQRWLPLIFAMSGITGIGFHIAGHGAGVAEWHVWAVLHTIASLLFLVVVILHVKSRWAWYKSFRKGIGKKSRLTLLLSLVFLFVALSGIALLGIYGANSELGLWHYKAGIALLVLSVLHIAKRYRWKR